MTANTAQREPKSPLVQGIMSAILIQLESGDEVKMRDLWEGAVREGETNSHAKRRVQRALGTLLEVGLVRKARGNWWRITPKGLKALAARDFRVEHDHHNTEKE